MAGYKIPKRNQNTIAVGKVERTCQYLDTQNYSRSQYVVCRGTFMCAGTKKTAEYDMPVGNAPSSMLGSLGTLAWKVERHIQWVDWGEVTNLGEAGLISLYSMSPEEQKEFDSMIRIRSEENKIYNLSEPHLAYFKDALKVCINYRYLRSNVINQDNFQTFLDEMVNGYKVNMNKKDGKFPFDINEPGGSMALLRVMEESFVDGTPDSFYDVPIARSIRDYRR